MHLAYSQHSALLLVAEIYLIDGSALAVSTSQSSFVRLHESVFTVVQLSSKFMYVNVQ